MALPNLKEVEWAINELENEESSKSGYLLLSALYTVREHMQKGESEHVMKSGHLQTSPTAEMLDLYGESNFLKAVAHKDSAAVFNIMDELMETLQVVNSRAYNSVMRKLHNI